MVAYCVQRVVDADLFYTEFSSPLMTLFSTLCMWGRNVPLGSCVATTPKPTIHKQEFQCRADVTTSRNSFDLPEWRGLTACIAAGCRRHASGHLSPPTGSNQIWLDFGVCEVLARPSPIPVLVQLRRSGFLRRLRGSTSLDEAYPDI